MGGVGQSNATRWRWVGCGQEGGSAPGGGRAGLSMATGRREVGGQGVADPTHEHGRR